jgi:predicted nucleic acid-binding protein
LRQWIENDVKPSFNMRILPVDLHVAIRCASLHVPDRRPERDALIAATALTHQMAVVTRNTRDFARTGVRLVNPWDF